MTITINNTTKEYPEPISIESLVISETGSTVGTAVAINDRVVRRALWTETFPAEGDSVVIIKAAYGG